MFLCKFKSDLSNLNLVSRQFPILEPLEKCLNVAGFNSFFYSCLNSVSSNNSDEEDDVIPGVRRYPFVPVPSYVRRYRRNVDMLGPIQEQCLQARRR